MDVWRITVAALRRWYVLLPMLGVTVLLVLAAGRGVQPEYDVRGTTMVVPGPSLQQIPNPYGGPDDANNAVVIVLNSPETRAAIAEMGLIPTYEVAPQSRSTVMNFEVRGATPEVAVETGMAVFQLAAAELRERQTAAGIRTSQQYSIDVLQTPSVTEAVTDGKLRNMAVVAVLGCGLSLALAVFFDDVMGLLMRHRRRRRRTQVRQEAAEQEAAEQEAAEQESRRPVATNVRQGGDDRPRAPLDQQGSPSPGSPSPGRRPARSKQSRKAKKAATAAGSGGAARAPRDAALSDAP